MIYSIHEIETWNRQMVEHNQNNAYVHYNPTDYEICKHLYYGLSHKQLADVCRRLTNYARTHDTFNLEQLRATALYFDTLARQERGLSVSAEYRDAFVLLSISFNRQFVTRIRQINGHKELKDNTWLIPSVEMSGLLDVLEEGGANVANVRAYLLSFDLSIPTTDIPLIPPPSNLEGLNTKPVTNRRKQTTRSKKSTSSKKKTSAPSMNTPKAKKEPRRKTPPIKPCTIEAKQVGDYHVAIRFPQDAFVIDDVLRNEVRRKIFKQDWNCWIMHIDDIPFLVRPLDRNLINCNELINIWKKVNPKTREKIEGTLLEIASNPRYVKLDFNLENKDIKLILNRSKSKRFHPKQKYWYVHKSEIPALLKAFEKLPHINNSQLQTFLPKPNQGVIPVNPQLYAHLERQPYRHQIQAAEFLLKIRKGILAHEMGGGKTFSAILSSAHLKGPKLVVCPASLKINWKKEIEMVVGTEQNIVIINGTKKWESCGDNGWCIINWDIMDSHIDNMIASNFIVGIFDECHFGRSINNEGKPGSKRAKMYVKITAYLDYVFALSGTPILNYTKDIFNQLVVTDHPLAIDFKEFAKTYCNAKFNGFGNNVNGSSNEHQLNNELNKVMLRARKDEMLDLPEKIRSFIPVDINLKNYYKRVEEYMNKRHYLSDDAKKIVELNQMRKEIALEKVQHSINFTKDLLERGEQVVIFTSYTGVVDAILAKFGDLATHITGSVSLKKREQAKVDFQAGTKRIIVCNFIAAGVGVTLTSSANLIVNDFDWLPANILQAEDRIHRIGQQRNANIFYLYSEASIELTMVSLLSKKLRSITVNVDGQEENIYETLLQELDKEYQQMLNMNPDNNKAIYQ